MKCSLKIILFSCLFVNSNAQDSAYFKKAYKQKKIGEYWSAQADSFLYPPFLHISDTSLYPSAIANLIYPDTCINLLTALMISDTLGKEVSDFILEEFSKYLFSEEKPVIVKRLSAWGNKSLNEILKEQDSLGVLFVPSIFSYGCLPFSTTHLESIDYLSSITLSLIY